MSSSQSLDAVVPITRQIASIFLDNPNADIILRSCDHVEFRAIKLFLSFSSSFFYDMFKLPPSMGGVGDEMKDGLCIVKMEENSKTIEALLLLCYPAAAVEFPVFENLDGAFALLEAADKYGMEDVKKKVRQLLIVSPFMTMEPLRAFAMACKRGWEEEAKMAARYISPEVVEAQKYTIELEYFTFGQVIRAKEYQPRCVRAVQSVINSFGASDRWGLVPSVELVSHQCLFSGYSKRKGWWANYVVGAGTALASQPCGATVRRPDLVGTALQEAFKCNLCKTTAIADLQSFSMLLEAEVDKALSEVSKYTITGCIFK